MTVRNVFCAAPAGQPYTTWPTSSEQVTTVRPRRSADRICMAIASFPGRYAIGKRDKPTTVRLNTPNREIARKRLRAIVLEKQREQKGIMEPKAVRVACDNARAVQKLDLAFELMGTRAQ